MTKLVRQPDASLQADDVTVYAIVHRNGKAFLMTIDASDHPSAFVVTDDELKRALKP